MTTAHITKQIRDNTIHTPVLRVLMRYEYQGKSHVKLVTLNQQEMSIINRTIKWAAHKGIEIRFQPV